MICTEEQASRTILNAWKRYLERCDDWHCVKEEMLFYKANHVNTSIEPNGVSVAIEMHGFFFRTEDDEDGNTGFILNLQNRVIQVKREFGELNYEIEHRYDYVFKMIMIPLHVDQEYSYIKIIEGEYMLRNAEQVLHIDEHLGMFSREDLRHMLMSSLLYEVC
jgi:hypothetical protein